MFIPEKQYRYLVNVMPIPCVDIVVVHDGKMLVLLRKPAQDYGGLWWIPGGRIHKNERWNDAVKRKVFEECGIFIEIVKQISSYELFSEYKSVKTHCITTTFIAHAIPPIQITLDDTVEDWKWVNQIDESWHPMLKKIVQDANIIKG